MHLPAAFRQVLTLAALALCLGSLPLACAHSSNGCDSTTAGCESPPPAHCVYQPVCNQNDRWECDLVCSDAGVDGGSSDGG